jgi:DNA-binding MarR family transcriptional regulator
MSDQKAMNGSGAGETALSSNHRVRYQLERTVAEYGPEFDTTPLALTLLLHRLTTLRMRANMVDLEALGLSNVQFNVMTVLYRSAGPLAMRELAEVISIRPPNLTNVVGELARLGLVEKSVNRGDRRSSLVAITSTGKKVMREFLPSHLCFLAEFYEGISLSKRITLVNLMSELLNSVEGNAEAGEPPTEPTGRIAPAASKYARSGPA